jgi:SAM-dependent methyltransferase
MPISKLRHVHARRRQLTQDLRLGVDFELWEETCVPSYCHGNLAAAYMSWWRLYAAVGLARRHANWDAVLDFGAAIGELRRLLPTNIGGYDFIEENDVAARYLAEQITDAQRTTLESAAAQTYSCIFALDSLEHNTDYAALLMQLASKLKPDGVLIISGPSESALYRLGRKIAGFDAHYHETNIFAIEAVAKAELELVDVRSLPPLFPLFRISVWKNPAGTRT